MADSRRSSRARKAVNYSAFANGEDDDDFADPTPPSKKTKTANKENQLKAKNDPSENRRQKKETTAPVECTKRQSLNEKVFDRDLEAALKLSLTSSDTVEVSEVTVETHVDNEVSPSVVIESPKSTNITARTPTSNKRPLPSSGEDDLEIIELSSELEDVTRKRRKAAVKPVIYDDDDDNEEDDKEVWNPVKDAPENVSDDDDDDDDDNSDDEFDPNDSDSDFGSSKKKKTAISKSKPKSKAPAKKSPLKPKPKSSTPATPVNTSGKVSKVTSKSASKSAPSTPSYSTPVRLSGSSVKRAWVPPSRDGSAGSPLSSISIKSPSSGLRLGLSRNQRVKSLHPTVTT